MEALINNVDIEYASIVIESIDFTLISVLLLVFKVILQTPPVKSNHLSKLNQGKPFIMVLA